MGILNFKKFFKPLKTIQLDGFKNSNIAVDALNMMCSMAYRYSDNVCITDKNKLLELYMQHLEKFLTDLHNLNTKTIWVFDDKKTLYKEKTRKVIHTKIQTEIALQSTPFNKTKYNIDICSKNYVSMGELISVTMPILQKYNISYATVEAGQEADYTCALLIKHKLVNGVISGDTDLLMYGATSLYIPAVDNTRFRLYTIDNLISQLKSNFTSLSHNVTYYDFVNICINLDSKQMFTKFKQMHPCVNFRDDIINKSYLKFVVNETNRFHTQNNDRYDTYTKYDPKHDAWYLLDLLSCNKTYSCQFV